MFILDKVGLDQKAIFDYYQDSLFESTSYINNSATNTIDRDKNPFTNATAINVYNADLKPSYYNNIPSIEIGNYDPVDVGVVANKIKSNEGSGGDYLSNEIYYRVAYLRKKLSQNKLTGHIHVGYLKDGNMSVDRAEMLNTIRESLKQALNNF
ncbi:hypothetical protein [Paenimyroides viscosum]|uniref:Uncharacterized protein n=1 Tax=Paenimyroides viscosum TaxID=2488729 RepID=A0A3P1AJ14_9FLAO|nr:hypothetical protein [Paenimyroides viscosum]RRA88955.1 hypothetical protein EG242_14775 [Paenimyroides viscosum]